jgi:hypothetical protein
MCPRVPMSATLALLSSWLLTGCIRTDYGPTSPYQPGPVIGKNVGSVAGVVAGNVAGLGVGTGEGIAVGVATTFNPNYHMVRHWRPEVTSDGRTIQIPYDVLVDEYGRPVKLLTAPTGNPAPPSVAQ